jgi:hypothetical protein
VASFALRQGVRDGAHSSRVRHLALKLRVGEEGGVGDEAILIGDQLEVLHSFLRTVVLFELLLLVNNFLLEQVVVQLVHVVRSFAVGAGHIRCRARRPISLSECLDSMRDLVLCALEHVALLKLRLS